MRTKYSAVGRLYEIMRGEDAVSITRVNLLAVLLMILSSNSGGAALSGRNCLASKEKFD